WLFFLRMPLCNRSVNSKRRRSRNGRRKCQRSSEKRCRRWLAGMINVLGGIISMLLAVVMGNALATPGPALLISELNASNLVHLLLSALNVMTFWYIGVLAVGLVK